mmetsp:Transcript_8717/g.27789  ORF Transcript_8717/g.27789 Transcript_8717/m.27789 type:complete len:295 (-) Transcript_8717:132-1016(-)
MFVTTCGDVPVKSNRTRADDVGSREMARRMIEPSSMRSTAVRRVPSPTGSRRASSESTARVDASCTAAAAAATYATLLPATRSSSSCEPRALAAACARKSASTSARARLAANRCSSRSVAKLPLPSTRSTLAKAMPSSSRQVEKGGMLPGCEPPTSAWWPRDATKKCGDEVAVVSLPAKTGEMTVMSGRCEPPASGWFDATTSPAAQPPRRWRSWNRTASAIAPRCTGRCGAFATRLPVASKMAQEKSRRSLMFVEIAVRCSTLPICSAMDMKRCVKTDSDTADRLGTSPALDC